jgi:hypothetical protein
MSPSPNLSTLQPTSATTLPSFSFQGLDHVVRPLPLGEGRMFMWEGGLLGANLLRVNFEQPREAMIESGFPHRAGIPARSRALRPSRLRDVDSVEPTTVKVTMD